MTASGANAQTVQKLRSLVTTDTHAKAVIELGHNDSITVAGGNSHRIAAIHSSRGENIISFEPVTSNSDGRDALGGYRMKKFELTSKSYDGDYLLSLVDKNGKTVLYAYTRRFAGGKDGFSLLLSMLNI
jgi:hypothetical protein